MRLRSQRCEGVKLFRRLVNRHQWHQRSALTGLKPPALFGRGIVRQCRAGKNEQQTLWFRLTSRGAQQVIKICNVHDFAFRKARLFCDGTGLLHQRCFGRVKIHTLHRCLPRQQLQILTHRSDVGLLAQRVRYRTLHRLEWL